MFATIRKLFSRASKADKGANKKAKGTQINQSVDDFKNKLRHEILTKQIIDTTADDDLLFLVFDNLITKLPKDYTKEYETVLAWNKPRQIFYVIWQLEGEVNNGGFNQFYYNPSGQYYKLLPEALTLIGANKFADLAERANNTYEQENEKITKHFDGTIKGFSNSYKNNPLNKYDDEFYQLYKTENLEKLQVEYIRRHITNFIDN